MTELFQNVTMPQDALRHGYYWEKKMKNNYRIIEILAIFVITFVSTNSLIAKLSTSNPDARDIVDGLREQMKHLRCAEVKYSVQSDFKASGKAIDSVVYYVRDGAKYHVVDQQRDTEKDTTEERRVVHNGEVVKIFDSRSRPLQPFIGQVYPSYSHGQFVAENDIFKICGFTLIEEWFERNQDRFTFDLLGIEEIDEVVVWKIRIKMPYGTDHEACNYLWISKDDSGYRIWRTLALVDDKPEQKLFEKRFTYGTLASLLPTGVIYIRYELDEQSGVYYHRYTKTLEVSKISVNQPIDPNLFEFNFPTGTSVLDTVAKVSYVVGEVDPGIDQVIDHQLIQLAQSLPDKSRPVEDEGCSTEVVHTMLPKLAPESPKGYTGLGAVCVAIIVGAGVAAMVVWRGKNKQ